MGDGRLIVCGLDIDANCTAARLFKRALWRYAASEDFKPKWKVGPGWFDTFVNPAGKAKAATAALDGDTRDMMNIPENKH